MLLFYDINHYESSIQGKGELLWEFNVGDPITSSAYVDENLELVSNPCISVDR